MKLSELNQRTGGLSNPSKMPCYSYNLPARECKTGAKLRKVAATTCKDCYALKGRYMFPSVQSALYRRLDTITQPEWVDSMVETISKREKSGYFRWHDSGDLQSLDHLRNINEVARQLPDVKFWLPTRELSIYSEYLRHEDPHSNLAVRVSAFKVDFPAPQKLSGKPVLSSTVHTHGNKPEGHVCPAPKQGNMCGSCRACWNPSIKNVSYLKH